MKKTLITLAILTVAVILVLTGCSSSIAVKTLVPAKVDVSGYKTIAVRSTQDDARWVLPTFWNSSFPFRYEINERYKRPDTVARPFDSHDLSRFLSGERKTSTPESRQRS